MNNYILNLLNIKDKNIYIKEKIEEKIIRGKNNKLVFGILTYNPTSCPKCGCADENYIVRMLRVTGYLSGSPKKSITKSCCDGKLAEFADRHNI